ncbi:hypothetical protein CTA1_6561 [Colletotrichum tanaceti]|uniref:Uncharacterized protein n=1 Tax=Colletotrichum tanaceti TaxID=1306861 RepID=A0A4U6X0N4_9PEZI|nr:hypothetical protein CTA1_6561 [Colletotrichum tanaceti]
MRCANSPSLFSEVTTIEAANHELLLFFVGILFVSTFFVSIFVLSDSAPEAETPRAERATDIFTLGGVVR